MEEIDWKKIIGGAKNVFLFQNYVIKFFKSGNLLPLELQIKNLKLLQQIFQNFLVNSLVISFETGKNADKFNFEKKFEIGNSIGEVLLDKNGNFTKDDIKSFIIQNLGNKKIENGYFIIQEKLEGKMFSDLSIDEIPKKNLYQLLEFLKGVKIYNKKSKQIFDVVGFRENFYPEYKNKILEHLEAILGFNFIKRYNPFISSNLILNNKKMYLVDLLISEKQYKKNISLIYKFWKLLVNGGISFWIFYTKLRLFYLNFKDEFSIFLEKKQIL